MPEVTECLDCKRPLVEGWEKSRGRCRRCQWSTVDGRRTIDGLVKLHGPFKRIVNVATGVAYAVPTETIVVEGLKGSELSLFEVWDEEKHGGR